MLERLDGPYTLGEGLNQRVVLILAAFLIAIHLALSWEAREVGVHIMRDDARYLILAQSLRDLGYHDLHRVSLPVHTLYPPGFPALLLAWGTVFGDSFVTYVTLNVLLSAAALALVFLALKRITSPGVALLCMVPVVVNPELVIRAGSLRSETAYLFFSMLALWALVRVRPSSRTVFLACSAALLATVIRINGVTLLGAIGLLWLFQRRFKPAIALAAVSALTIGAWMVWALVTPESVPESSYLGDILAANNDPRSFATKLWARTGIRLWRIFALILPSAIPLPSIAGTPIDNLLLSGTMVLSLAAGVIVLMRRWPVAGLYLCIYLLSLAVWPYLRGRFVEPILPLVIPALLLGAAGLVGAFRPSWRLPVMMALLLVVTGTGSLRSGQRVAAHAGCGPLSLSEPPPCLGPEQSSYLLAVDQISKSTAPEANFLTLIPEPLYHYTGRQSISSATAFRIKPVGLLEYLEEQEVEYVLLTSNAGWISDRLEPHCSRLTLEGVFPPRTYLLRIMSPGEAVSSTGACDAIAEHRERAARQ
jgi:hypothetical protein